MPKERARVLPRSLPRSGSPSFSFCSGRNESALRQGLLSQTLVTRHPARSGLAAFLYRYPHFAEESNKRSIPLQSGPVSRAAFVLHQPPQPPLPLPFLRLQAMIFTPFPLRLYFTVFAVKIISLQPSVFAAPCPDTAIFSDYWLISPKTAV